MKFSNCLPKQSFAAFWLAATVGLTASPVIAREGGAHGGGGGLGEPEFIAIATNIQAWIEADAGTRLKLPADLTAGQFKEQMVKIMKTTSVVMTDSPVEVQGRPKTCKGELLASGRGLITCTRSTFLESAKSDIDATYRLVFHEYAGLAGVERNTGGDSDYRVSQQVSKFLQNEIVRRLPIVDGLAVIGTKSARLLGCHDDRLVLLQVGQYGDAKSGSPNLTGSSQVAQQLAPADFFTWLRANKKSPLSKLESVAEKCVGPNADHDSFGALAGDCVAWPPMLTQLAPAQGMSSASHVDEIESGATNSSQKIRYLELREQLVKSHRYQKSVIEIEIEVSTKEDMNSVDAKYFRTKAFSQIRLMSLKRISTDQKGVETPTLIYQSKPMRMDDLQSCVQVQI